MAILPPTIFASIVSSSKDELSIVSKIIRNDCNGDAETFQKACDALDYKTANDILEEIFKSLTGHEPVSMGLLYFASELAHHFPNIENEVANAFSDVDKIRAIEKHYIEIMMVLKNFENNQGIDNQDAQRIDCEGIRLLNKLKAKLGQIRDWNKSWGGIAFISIDNKRILMELIHALSAVYAKTDRFLNSGR